MSEEIPKEDSRLSPEQIQSWKDLRCEIRMSVGESEFWMVPEYTDADRIELTPEDLLKHKNVLDVFPGAKVTEFISLKSGQAQAKKNGHSKAAPPVAAAKPTGQGDDHPF